MNIYKNLNDLTKYIEDNLEEEIDYNILSKFLGVNSYTLKRIFSLITGISLSDYIRKRRLSMAGYDLYNKKYKVIDIAIKYQYDNATSFSRTFEKFHGIKPSQINKESKLKEFPRIIFDENVNITSEIDYEIINLPKLDLYGIGIKTNNNSIGIDAPKFFSEVENKNKDKYGFIKYGMITYDSVREESQEYYCLYDKKVDNYKLFIIPEGKWLRFRINSQDSKEIQDKSHEFYNKFLPSCKFNLKELPELEYYHDNITDFLVAIY